jgi:hypothetical protein
VSQIGSLTSRKRKKPSLILRHINIKPARSWNLLQHPPRPRRSSKPIKSSYRLQHSRDRDHANIHAETFVRPSAVVDVAVQGPIERDGFRGWIDYWVPGGGDEGDEDIVAGFHRDGTAVVVDCHGLGGFAVGAEGAVHACGGLVRGRNGDGGRTDAFHGVVKDLLVSFGGVHFCESVNIWEILLALVREIEVKCLRELLKSQQVSLLPTWFYLQLEPD